MANHFTSGPRAIDSVLLHIGRWLMMLLPTILLVGAAYRSPEPNPMLWFGTAFQLAVFVLSFFSSQSWRQPLGPSIITLYLIALAWMWFGDTIDDPFNHLAKAILLIVPLSVFAYNSLYESGAPMMRRANILALRLANRKEWPADAASCRTLPEVKALRAALTLDPAPALALLDHPRIEVRIAALSTLEFRKDWRPGQAELVLQVAQHAEQPALRAAAVTALANIEDRPLVEMLSQFLHDNSREVRQAATEALLWETEQRWGWIRFAVRRYLADPLFLGDGALVTEGQLMTQEAVNDLTAWCAEKGVIAVRAAMTLAEYYRRAMSESSNRDMIERIRKQLGDPHTPAVLRLEQSKVLQEFQELDTPLLKSMLNPANPAPLRLTAVETILTDDYEHPLRNEAVNAMRDLARLPNREIALTTADIIQRRLGVDMGLGLGQPLPPVQSRQAGEITRKVMHWATQYDTTEDEELEDSRVVG